MIRSMYSGISGLKNFQTKLDVIGNNISNVNTYGFKKGRTVFKDLISQTTSGASAPTGTRGGVNAKQVGLGSQLSAIDTIHSGGSLQSTGNTLDLAISGDGFFQVADGKGATATAGPNGFENYLYTRAGNFYMDKEGYLVNSDGKYLVGASAVTTGAPAQFPLANLVSVTPNSGNLDATGNDGIPDKTFITGATTTYKPIQIPTDAQSMSISQDGTVTFVDKGGELRWSGQLVLAKFPNAGGLEKAGNNYFKSSPNSGTPLNSVGTQDGLGTVNSGFLEMSNVDLSEEFTDMIVAQRGFQANTRIITTSDQILEELVNLKR
ncbi:flagellar hook-basal body complex protein [Psychrobacillus sp. FSL K6-4046]|uniref:flagellar hook-basal body complex protein n=1 Tax=unclassified Psychrobacillus TaxID=2636677 RepID=UPI00203A4B99|nr:flagellar hook-basal body complex protein [Psychrobacillus sp. MER TA 171]MCM3356926.1 flagellar basal body rod protein FlgG [Psychrobacillus sp. MER TA 171]